MYSSDKKGKIPHPQNLLNGFCNIMEECELSELDLSGGKFTWEKSRGKDTWVCERLDRAFASSSWWTKFPLCNLRVVNTSVSDHDPIMLDFLKVEISKRKFRFRFENIWLKEPNFVVEVIEVWKKLPSIHLLPKLIEVSSFMARWGRSFFHKFREKIKEHKNSIARLKDLTDDDSIKEYLAVKDSLNTLLFQEETYWKQRAKLFWLEEGDENTKFFHSNASARRKANRITHLFDDNEVLVEDHEGMSDIVYKYFSNLFAGESVE